MDVALKSIYVELCSSERELAGAPTMRLPKESERENGGIKINMEDWGEKGAQRTAEANCHKYRYKIKILSLCLWTKKLSEKRGPL